MSPVLYEQHPEGHKHRESASGRTSEQLPFWFVLHSEGLNPSEYKGKLSVNHQQPCMLIIVGSYVCRQYERKILKNNPLLYFWASLCLSPSYPHSITGTTSQAGGLGLTIKSRN